MGLFGISLLLLHGSGTIAAMYAMMFGQKISWPEKSGPEIFNSKILLFTTWIFSNGCLRQPEQTVTRRFRKNLRSSVNTADS
jgi:hypothetical protein